MLRLVSCVQCPAAYVVHGATRHDSLVLCRVESTERGQRSAKAGPIALIRASQSPASFHGFCLNRLPTFVDEVEEDYGVFTTPIERHVAASAGAAGSDPRYTACPSWRSEYRNRHAAKLVDLPNHQRRLIEAPR
jgi:hypothetical protein